MLRVALFYTTQKMESINVDGDPKMVELNALSICNGISVSDFILVSGEHLYCENYFLFYFQLTSQVLTDLTVSS